MKRKQILVYIIVIITLLCTKVYAYDIPMGDIEIVPSKTELESGEDFTLQISLTDVRDDTEIKSVIGCIDINDDILEPLTVESIEQVDGKVKIDENNNLPVYDAKDENYDSTSKGISFNSKTVDDKVSYEILINFEKEVKKDVDLLEINFKIKDSATQGNYDNAIKYKLVTLGTSDENDIKVKDKAVDLSIKDNSNSENNTTNNVVNNTTNNTVNNVVNNTENQTQNIVNNGSDNTIADGRLPDTGYRIILIPVIVLMIIGIVFYKKYDKYSKM